MEPKNAPYFSNEADSWLIIRLLHARIGSILYAIAVSILYAVVMFLPSADSNRLVASRNEMLPPAPHPLYILIYFSAVGLVLGAVNAWTYSQASQAQDGLSYSDRAFWVGAVLGATALAVVLAQSLFNAAAPCMFEMCLGPFVSKIVLGTFIYGAAIAFGTVPLSTWTGTVVVLVVLILFLSIVGYVPLLFTPTTGC